MTLKARYDKIQELSTVTVPWEVWHVLNSEFKKIIIVGDQFELGADFCTLQEARIAVEWYAKQLGGNISWDQKKQK